MAADANSANGEVSTRWQLDTRKEVVTYLEVLQELADGTIDSFTEKYSFCDIKTHFVKPDEDIEQALNRHCKVALFPGATYFINNPWRIMSCCYLIGNGATIQINCSGGAIMSFSNSIDSPMIFGMDIPTITNVTFVGSADSVGQLIFSTCKIMIHDCTFVNIFGTCLRTTTLSYIRGCLFIGCERALRADGDYPIRVKHCTFRNCIVCIATKCDFEICGNSCVNAVCFLLTNAYGKIKNNFVSCNSSEDSFKNVNLYTCFGGNINPLCTLHIVANRKKWWPIMSQNSFFKSKLFLGYRKGVFKPTQCAFNYTSISLDINAVNKLSMHGAYDHTVTVSKIVSISGDQKVIVPCECGVSHLHSEVRSATITEETKVNPFAQSCHCLEFSSDEE